MHWEWGNFVLAIVGLLGFLVVIIQFGIDMATDHGSIVSPEKNLSESGEHLKPQR